MADLFSSQLHWTGALKGPTADPLTFSRDLEVAFDNHTLRMSSAPGFRGDPDRLNPEELVVGAVSACQALTYLSLAARAGVRVTSYTDRAEARLMVVEGRTRLTGFILRPIITIDPASDPETARALVEKAHGHCMIANSLNGSVAIEPEIAQPVGASLSGV